ncbi:MAG: hypothetical protein GTO37_08945 [Planctomycetales bacterium]|nr:hypothetical protein [Planctomycetales bacterium]
MVAESLDGFRDTGEGEILVLTQDERRMGMRTVFNRMARDRLATSTG